MKTALRSAIGAAALILTASASHAQKDVAETVTGDPQFTMLVKALNAAGMAETLKRRGPFTVFAPTNAAFAKVPPATLNKLLADKTTLRKVLIYHVVPGRALSTALKPGTIRSAAGEAIAVRTSPVPMVNNAKILKADVQASNGVIHVIDTVLMPNLTKPVKKKLPAMGWM